MHFFTYILSYSIGMFIGLLLCLKIGHMLGRRQHPREKEGGGGGALDGVVFALVGLMLAFTFSNSLTKYDAHREDLTREANYIAGLYEQLALLPENERIQLRTLLKQYAEIRLTATQASINSAEEKEALTHSEQLQGEIWGHIVRLAQSGGNSLANNKIIDAFNDMSGAPAEQLANRRGHMPGIIYMLIFALTLMAAMVAGYGMAARSELPYFRIVIFSIAVVATMYVIIDLEYPRSGVFHSAANNQTLVEVIDNMR